MGLIEDLSERVSRLERMHEDGHSGYGTAINLRLNPNPVDEIEPAVERGLAEAGVWGGRQGGRPHRGGWRVAVRRLLAGPRRIFRAAVRAALDQELGEAGVL